MFPHLQLAVGLALAASALTVLAEGSTPGAQATCLAQDAIQTASLFTGQEADTPGIQPGQAKSSTDAANFINFCSGHTLTNGRQLPSGSCNGIPMGKIPAATKMISALITRPQPGDRLVANTTFEILVQTRNLHAGIQTNPAASYYTGPQDVDEEGYVMGHCHVVIEELGSLRTLVAPDPLEFVFFRGLNDAGVEGLLKAEVTGGLRTGFYRVCTMVAAGNHQPVLMPMAQRGGQDDCVRFAVVDEAEDRGRW
ncbi:hypothetical protein QBC39DRAFT_134713 [Podospora conica]|nr:hypothetical protein QBC39DRAFT_134713 [Schizothecium conicum]